MSIQSFRPWNALLILLLAAGAGAQTITDADDGTVLRQILIFGRHGVRSPTMAPADYARFSPKPYPDFGVGPGLLTEHGRKASVLLGSYYREYLLHERLLTGNAEWDAARSYFRANSIQRSNVTAAALGEGLFDGRTVGVRSFALGQPDPVFDPIAAKVAVVDGERAANEVRQVWTSGAALASAYSAEFGLVRGVLFGYPPGTEPAPATPAGVVDPTSLPIPLQAAKTGVATGTVVDLGGLLATMTAADPFVMEYTGAKSAADVGWGRLSMSTLSQQTRLVTLAFDVVMRTPYLNRVQSSNAASHVLRTLEQAVIRDRVAGAFGGTEARVQVIISSDAYVIGLAGLLGVHWKLPGYQPDFCPPGGALVFELRQRRGTGEYLVRVHYTAQTWDQLRELTPLTRESPPATVQLLVPEGREPGTGLDVPFGRFQRILRRAIGTEYVEDPGKEVAPGVLSGVEGR